ncbi:hypothetical protein RIF29_27493 [Crotalaria pallida]|uniref:GIR1-like zinc ribbon domain-containing protein n=1 Tax=Crotalaria pallida TaxID=3830 RepID=A0AAN9HYT2_CROPI
MSKRARSPKLELKLNLSSSIATNPSTLLADDQSLEFSTSPSSVSTCSWDQGSSCVSSEADVETRSLILVGCLRCLMYVMLSEMDPNPKCPKCKSTVLLHFLNNNKENIKKTTSKRDANYTGDQED